MRLLPGEVVEQVMKAYREKEEARSVKLQSSISVSCRQDTQEFERFEKQQELL